MHRSKSGFWGKCLCLVALGLDQVEIARKIRSAVIKGIFCPNS
jgi:hypothetical protein